MKWAAFLFIALLLVSCWWPWVTIESKNIIVDGFHAAGTNFGKPGWFHYLISFFFIVFLLLGKPWSVRVAFFISALNLAWAIRNFIVVSTCYAGICPQKHLALYLIVAASAGSSVFTLLVKPQIPHLPKTLVSKPSNA